ncbi:hypothetical protein [Rhodohalobacter halophilus]|uniref:hypothetical protein n=1 Tax=Rhodohalobacter halophilus TaxID=1812810 RepID=UPI00083F92AF|nr:hypothetical protein [Rhodohalobacter halophilus]
MSKWLLLFIMIVFPYGALSQEAVSVVVQPTSEAEISVRDLLPSTNVLASENRTSFSLKHQIRTDPGVAFLSSAFLPGSAQAVNQNWLRAGLFAALEVSAIILTIDRYNRAGRLETRYEEQADQNWSVVQYAHWLVEYHEVHNLSNPHIDELRDEIEGVTPAFDPSVDWQAVDITLLRESERNTRYMTTDDQSASRFSHALPAYGSQQYYELIAKYYQYQSGWRDYHDFHDQLGHTGNRYNRRFLFDRNGSHASSLFWQFADDAERFNDLYRSGRSFKMLLVANHVVSALDALFTVQLKQNRIEATPSIVPGRQISMTVRF